MSSAPDYDGAPQPAGAQFALPADPRVGRVLAAATNHDGSGKHAAAALAMQGATWATIGGLVGSFAVALLVMAVLKLAWAPAQPLFGLIAIGAATVAGGLGGAAFAGARFRKQLVVPDDFSYLGERGVQYCDNVVAFDEVKELKAETSKVRFRAIVTVTVALQWVLKNGTRVPMHLVYNEGVSARPGVDRARRLFAERAQAMWLSLEQTRRSADAGA